MAWNTFEKMLNDVDTFEGRDEGYKDRVNQAIKNWDYLISPSPYASKCFKSAFNFKKEILEIGYPRNDIFHSNNEAQLEVKKKMIKQKLGIKDQRKVILYAPTFRDDDINKAKNTSLNYTWIYKNERKFRGRVHSYITTSYYH